MFSYISDIRTYFCIGELGNTIFFIPPKYSTKTTYHFLKWENFFQNLNKEESWIFEINV